MYQTSSSGHFTTLGFCCWIRSQKRESFVFVVILLLAKCTSNWDEYYQWSFLCVVLKEQTASILWICRSKSKFVFANPYFILFIKFISAGFWQPHLPCNSVPFGQIGLVRFGIPLIISYPEWLFNGGHTSFFIKGRPTSGNWNFQIYVLCFDSGRLSSIFPFKSGGFALSASNY